MKTVVVSVSPQARASLAAKYKLSVAETAKKVTSFFKKLGKPPNSQCFHFRSAHEILVLIAIKGSCMSAYHHGFSNLINKLGKRDEMLGLLSILSLFRKDI